MNNSSHLDVDDIQDFVSMAINSTYSAGLPDRAINGPDLPLIEPMEIYQGV